MYALDFANDELVKILIDAGADVNARHRHGKTPLMYSQSIDNTKLLLEAGADPYTRTNLGENVLFYVSDEKILSQLLEQEDVTVIPNRKEIYPDFYVRNPEMAKLYMKYHEYLSPLMFLSLCREQTRKVYVNIDKLEPRTDEALD